MKLSYLITLDLTAGLRVDIPFWEDGLENEDFNTRSVAFWKPQEKILKERELEKESILPLTCRQELGLTGM